MKPFRLVGGKPIYVFEDHADAIIPWGDFRKTSSQVPSLITFDSHTDTMPAFGRFGHSEFTQHRDENLWDEHRRQRSLEVDYQCTESLKRAAKDLWHDEHICAAYEAGIISHAYVLSPAASSAGTNEEPYLTYLPNFCYHGCNKGCHDQDCVVEHSDRALEDSHVGELLKQDERLQGFINSGSPLILDIDLDYFRTSKSLEPDSCESFRGIFKRASIVTIATEPDWSRDLWLDDCSGWSNSLERFVNLLRS